MQKCLLTLLLCFIGVYARAQYQVSGTVMDQTGETLIGATIREVGDNNNGTITDFNGKYTIKVSKKNAQLSVSYVGYEDQTVSVQGKTIVDIVLKQVFTLKSLVMVYLPLKSVIVPLLLSPTSRIVAPINVSPV